MKKKLLFIIPWTLYFFTIVAFSSTYTTLGKALYFSVIIVSFQLALFCINNCLLIPLMLEKKRILLYVTAGIFMIFVMVLLRFQLPVMDGGNTLKYSGLRPRILFFTFNLVLAYIASNFYYFVLSWIKSLQLKSEMKHLKVESELSLLKSRINPHFLFNTLNNIYSLCYLKDDKAAVAVMKLSELMRYVLHDGNASMVELQKEIQFVNNFIALQMLKKDEAACISFKVDGVKSTHKITPLLLINFFENCFKHGDIAFNANGWIKAELKVDDLNRLTFFIVNSKQMSKAERKEMKSGTGLKNVRKRLSILYGEKQSLVIKDDPDRYSVHLKLDLDEVKRDFL